MNQELLNQFSVLANLPGNQSYLLSHKETNEIFVLKTIQSRLNYEDQVRALQKRYNELQDCQNLCKMCFYQIEEPQSISILYNEPKINFRKEISTRMLKKQFWTLEELLNTFWHTLVALNNFHYVGLFHGDIRVNSIACKSDGSIILLDQFCTGNVYYKTVEEIIADQDGFLSPEFLDPNQDLLFTTIENDIFSLGLVFFEACTLKKSRDMYEWKERNFNYQIYQERLMNIEQLYGKDLALFLSQMTDFNIQSRTTTEEALVQIAQLKQKQTQRDQEVNIQRQSSIQLSQSHLSHQQQLSPHYLDQSNVQRNNNNNGIIPNARNNVMNQNDKNTGNSFDNGMNQQNCEAAYNVAVDKKIQNSQLSKQSFKLNINYSNSIERQVKQQLNSEQNSGKLSQLLTNETIKDNSKNQEITQFENFSISDNSVSILSFENTMCSHHEDTNIDKRRQIPEYKKSVFKVKNIINGPPVNKLPQNEKESSVFYIVEEEEAIDKQLIQKTMVNRIEKEKRELAQVLSQDVNQFLNYAQYNQIQERQVKSSQPPYKNNQIFQQSQIQQQQQQHLATEQLNHYQQHAQKQNQHFQIHQETIQKAQLQSKENQRIHQQQKENQFSQTINKIPANPRSQQVSIQLRRNSAFLPNQQIINQKENINQNAYQIIVDQDVSDGSQQATHMIPDQLTGSKNIYTRKIRGLNKSVDMSKAIQLVSNQQQIQNNGNHIQIQNSIKSCKYSNKQEITFPSSVLSSSNSSIGPINNQQIECEGINIISYDIMNMQSPKNMINKNEKQTIKTLFNRSQNIFSSKIQQQNNNLKECPSSKNSQLINKNNPNNNMYNPNNYINNDEWNYPTNSQRFAYIQINK